MSKKKKILAFSGSNNSRSINQNLIEYTAELFDENVSVIDLKKYNAPIYSMDIQNQKGVPNQIKELKELIDEHDAYLVGLPEHNGTMTSLMKNTIDWLSVVNISIFNDRPLFLVSTSPGKNGGRTGLAHFESLMNYLGGKVFQRFSLGRFHENFDDEDYELLNTEEREDLINKVKDFESKL